MNTALAREKRRLARITSSKTEDDEEAKKAGKGAAKSKKAEDDEPEAEGEDDDEPDAEDDDEPKGKKSRKAKSKKASDEDDEDDGASASAVAAEGSRCAGLVSLAAQADRLGVNFDASAAIRKGMSVASARRSILDAAADADGEETTAIATPKESATKSRSMDRDAKKAAWSKALKRR